MTKRIFRSIIGAAAAVILCCTAIIIGVLFNHFNAVQRNQLAAQTELASHGVELDGAAFLKGLEIEGYRLTWIAADGVVLYDTEKDAASMENHLDREEVKEAQKYGIGESERMSDAIAEKMLYYAKRLNDGTVLRVSVAQSTVYAILFGMLQPILILFTIAVILAAVLARRLARHIVEPLDRLDLDNPLEIDAYEELSPLLTRIEHQHRLLSKQFTQLKRKQDEFSAVTDNMSEGLILLGEKGEILSINRTAERLFDTNGSCVGKDILTVDRSVRMQKLLKAAQDGNKSETHARLAGGDYQINANPVISEGKVVGICIIAFDITEKTRAEQIRREFSANVSHELKTPLHAIMGSAELIEAGLVKAEDMPRFVERIRIEGARLLTLIDDIIRLSQLDEGGEMPREEVNLKELAEEAAEALEHAASVKKATFSINGDAAVVVGVRRLLYEIVFNLCDNAIKYNIEGGRVIVTVSKENDSVQLTVEDTGIGIPPEDQAHVFERFYRVDKSHSRDTGGTGLGLSIVKHAAIYHHAEVLLESKPGKGTKITVSFPNIN